MLAPLRSNVLAERRRSRIGAAGLRDSIHRLQASGVSADRGPMAPSRTRPDSGTWPHSPELALVDPDFAEGAPTETERRDARDVGDAIRRLTELSDVRPPSRERRRNSSLVFAASAWATLAVVVAGSFPHGI